MSKTDFNQFINEQDRQSVELFNPQNESDTPPSLWCMVLMLACNFAIVGLMLFLVLSLMVQSLETPVNAQQQRPGWTTYHYALPMVLCDTSRTPSTTTVPVPTTQASTTTTVTTTSTTTSTSTSTTLSAPLDWMSMTPDYLILNYTTQTIAITGTGFVPGMLIHVPLIGYLPVDVSSPGTGSFTVDKKYLTIGYFGVNPIELTCYLLLPSSRVSDYQFLKVIDPNKD